MPPFRGHRHTISPSRQGLLNILRSLLLTLTTVATVRRQYRSPRTRHMRGSPRPLYDDESMHSDTGLDLAGDSCPADDDVFCGDEQTLVNILMKDDYPSGTVNRDALRVESLRQPIKDLGTETRQGVIDVIAPLLSMVKNIFVQDISQSRKKANENCTLFLASTKEICQILDVETEEFQRQSSSSVKTIQRLFEQLEAEHSARDQLWTAFEHEITAIVSSGRDRLEELPTAVEKRISGLEKDAQSIQKEEDPEIGLLMERLLGP